MLYTKNQYCWQKSPWKAIFHMLIFHMLFIWLLSAPFLMVDSWFKVYPSKLHHGSCYGALRKHHWFLHYLNTTLVSTLSLFEKVTEQIWFPGNKSFKWHFCKGKIWKPFVKVTYLTLHNLKTSDFLKKVKCGNQWLFKKVTCGNQ